jgi:hypothetical protein
MQQNVVENLVRELHLRRNIVVIKWIAAITRGHLGHCVRMVVKPDQEQYLDIPNVVVHLVMSSSSNIEIVLVFCHVILSQGAAFSFYITGVGEEPLQQDTIVQTTTYILL